MKTCASCITYKALTGARTGASTRRTDRCSRYGFIMANVPQLTTRRSRSRLRPVDRSRLRTLCVEARTQYTRLHSWPCSTLTSSSPSPPHLSFLLPSSRPPRLSFPLPRLLAPHLSHRLSNGPRCGLRPRHYHPRTQIPISPQREQDPAQGCDNR